MKLFNKLTAAMLSVALMAGFASCTETAEYKEPTVPNNAQVYFPNTASATISLLNEQDSFVVKVRREVAKGELIVPISAASDSADVFTFPEEVVFAADSLTADVVVKFDFANIIPDTDYPVSIKLLGDDTTPYGASAVNLVVKYAPWTAWKKFGTGVYTLTQMWGAEVPVEEVYARQSVINPTKQQYKIVIKTNGGPNLDMIVDCDATTGECAIGEHFTGYNHSSYGPVYVSDLNTYAGKYQATSSFDSKTGLFSLYLIYYVGAGYFGHGYEYLQLDGYTQPDYSLKMEEKGHYIAPDGTDNTLIYIYKGADAFSYKYAIEEGALDEAGIEAMVDSIVDGTIEAEEYEESGYHLFPLKKAGDYTIVAVSFDKAGKAMSANYLTFEFAPVGQPSPWESLGMATYRDDIVTMFFSNAPNAVYEVEIQENTETPGVYRLVNPYGAAFPLNEEGDYDASKNYYMVIDASNPEQVTVKQTYTGMNWGYGEFVVWSLADYYLAKGKTAEEVAAAGYFGKLENGIITFPAEALLVAMLEYQNGGLYGSNVNGKFAVALPGVELPEDEAAEEGGEEATAPARRAAKQINNNVESFGKFSLKGRPANADAVAKYLQSTIH